MPLEHGVFRVARDSERRLAAKRRGNWLGLGVVGLSIAVVVVVVVVDWMGAGRWAGGTGMQAGLLCLLFERTC